MCQIGEPVKPVTVVTPSLAAARAVSLSFSAARCRTPSGSPSPHTSGGTTPWWRASIGSQTAWPTRWLPIAQTFRPLRSSSSRRPAAVAVVGERGVDVEVVAPAGELEAVEAPGAGLLGELGERQVGPLAGEQSDGSCHMGREGYGRAVGSGNADRDRGWRPRRAVPLDPVEAPGPGARGRASTSATRPTTRSASASCSATRRWPRSRPPTRSPTRRSRGAFVRWSEIDVHYRGEVVTSGGHGFSALGRKELLDILQRRAAALGVDLRFRTEVTELDGDLVVAADGVNCTLRARVRLRARRWTGAARRTPGSAPTTSSRPSRSSSPRRRSGVVQVHAYPVQRLAISTFIVETHAALQLDKAAVRGAVRLPADREPHALDQLRHRPQRVLAATGTSCCSATRRTPRTSRSARGTKLAMEDAISLAWAVREGDIDAYEAERRPIVESTQRAAQGSLEWFEGIGRYMHQDPRTFAFNLLTRSRRITHGELRMRDPDFVATLARRAADVHAVPAARAGAGATASWSRRWTCTRPSTARRATSTSCTSARGRSAAPGW